MLGFGGIVRHNTQTLDRPKAIRNIQNPALLTQPTLLPLNLQQDDDQSTTQNSRMANPENKVLPSEINAEILRITIPGVSGSFVVDSSSGLISKIYFQKKQFI